MDHEENIGALGGRICTYINIREACEDRNHNTIYYRDCHNGVLYFILRITTRRNSSNCYDSGEHTDAK